MCESQENHDSVRRIVTYSMRLLSGHRNDNRQTEPAAAGDASRDALRIGQNRCAAVPRGPQANELRQN